MNNNLNQLNPNNYSNKIKFSTSSKYLIITFLNNNSINQKTLFLPKISTLDPTGYWGPYNLVNNTFLPHGIIGISINFKPIVSNLTFDFIYQSYMSNPNEISIYYFAKDFIKNNKYDLNDFNNVTQLLNFQLENNIHSPILGFMFDGLPIYGPIGFSNNDRSHVTIIESSYNSDHKFDDNKGDLDICNGKFGITPEYPNGIYHYYFTIKKDKNNQILMDNNSNFIPDFPYSIALFKGIPEIRNFTD